MSKPRGIKDEILRLRNEGKSYKQIAKELNCVKSSVAFHCSGDGKNIKRTAKEKIIKRIRIKTKECPDCKKLICKRAKRCLQCDSKTRIIIEKLTLKDLIYRQGEHCNKYTKIRMKARNKYKKLKKECQNCGYSKYTEICHIKAISEFSEDTLISEINAPENLIFLCRNCHWEFDHKQLTLEQIRG